MVRALLIDLDDTLYDEASYVRSGMAAVAQEMSRLPVDRSADQIAADLLHELARNGRGRIFDTVLERLGLAPDPALIAGLVETYRDHNPSIALWPGVREALADLTGDHRLAIVTDGLGRMQRRKVAALGVEPLVEDIIYCWELGWPKPDPRAYVSAMQALGADAATTLVVGDNPGHDMAAARAAGVRSVRVRSGRFAAEAHEDQPADAEATSFATSAQTIRRLETSS
jgi:putative hydrolase of the HAD superfamily